MRSRHADAFNHDPWADGYDAGVRDEANPIRAGYEAVLRWTVEQARVDSGSVVLDLGSGTGNTTALIPAAAKVICVDVSEGMAAQAGPKLGHLSDVEFRRADLLEVFDHALPPLDAVVSTYSVHHLTEDEKAHLHRAVHAALKPGGRVAYGDLMFENREAKARLAEAWGDEERQQVMKSLDEEFPWFVDRAVQDLGAAGFEDIETRRFSTLSWGIAARLHGRS